MKMKKVAKTTKYKFNITRSVGVIFTYRFSIDDIENITKKALKNNGVKNPDEIIKKYGVQIAELKNRLNKSEARFDDYKKATDKTIADLKNELQELSKQSLIKIGREMAKGFYDQSQKMRSKQKEKTTRETLLCLSPDGDLYLESRGHRLFTTGSRKTFARLCR